ncbi:MAG: hypothetical protein WCO42_08355 [bacterium]
MRQEIGCENQSGKRKRGLWRRVQVGLVGLMMAGCATTTTRISLNEKSPYKEIMAKSYQLAVDCYVIADQDGYLRDFITPGPWPTEKYMPPRAEHIGTEIGDYKIVDMFPKGSPFKMREYWNNGSCEYSRVTCVGEVSDAEGTRTRLVSAGDFTEGGHGCESLNTNYLHEIRGNMSKGVDR